MTNARRCKLCPARAVGTLYHKASVWDLCQRCYASVLLQTTGKREWQPYVKEVADA